MVSATYSFVFHRLCPLFEKRASKLVMIVVSMWTACCVFPVAFFTDVSLTAPLPSFDGRAVQCPSVQNLRDYMSWRQVHLLIVRLAKLSWREIPPEMCVPANCGPSWWMCV